jgi:hypothetical protein
MWETKFHTHIQKHRQNYSFVVFRQQTRREVLEWMVASTTSLPCTQYSRICLALFWKLFHCLQLLIVHRVSQIWREHLVVGVRTGAVLQTMNQVDMRVTAFKSFSVLFPISIPTCISVHNEHSRDVGTWVDHEEFFMRRHCFVNVIDSEIKLPFSDADRQT